MKKIQIVKEIILAGVPRKVDTVIDIDDESAKILIRKKFAKDPTTAKEVVVLIEAVTDLKELEKYSADTRQLVVAAYSKKLNELTPVE